MESVSTGKLIAEKRKSLELTQNELAQQLGVKEKAVVKWEEKNVLPKNEVVLPLCEALGVTPSELVAGKTLQESEVKATGEDHALRYVKEKNNLKFRKLFELLLICTTLVSCIGMVYTVCRVEATTYLKIVLIVLAALNFVVTISVTCVLFKGETDYECPNCKARFTPEIREFMQSKRTKGTRKLTCPNCERTSDCKCKANVIKFVKK